MGPRNQPREPAPATVAMWHCDGSRRAAAAARPPHPGTPGTQAAAATAGTGETARCRGSLGGFRDGGQDMVQAEVPGLLDVAAEPERPREFHRDEPVRPRHDRARRRQCVPGAG